MGRVGLKTPDRGPWGQRVRVACIALLCLPLCLLTRPVAAQMPAAGEGDPGPEPALVRIFSEVENNRLDLALEQTEGLLRKYPNFRLGHLIKGDLLLARSRPLSTFGQIPAGGADASEKLADLREEAIARLRGYRSKPPANQVPRYLLQFRADQKYAVVVDTQRSRIYLYANEDGRPRFVTDYYFTQGKLGAEKVKEGDRKTPIGVYHVTGSLPRAKIGDFYGIGAYPINYPNEWDRRQGRNGHGIWLHGTPSDTFSRPPKASDGCMVLANPDLDALGRNLQLGLTPVIVSPTVEWESVEDWQRDRNEFSRVLELWRTDWESRDTQRFISHYARDFQSADQNLAQFAQQKKRVNESKEWIKITLSNVGILRNPGREEVMVVTFDQDYRSNNLNQVSRKRQYWVKENGDWKIIYEGAYQ